MTATATIQCIQTYPPLEHTTRLDINTTELRTQAEVESILSGIDAVIITRLSSPSPMTFHLNV